MSRTALLIRCSNEQACSVRVYAEKERRTISGYVLNIVMRAVQLEERLQERLTHYAAMNRVLSRRSFRPPGPRTAILIRCTIEEANLVRNTARRREMSVSGFVLQALQKIVEYGPSALSIASAAKIRLML